MAKKSKFYKTNIKKGQKYYFSDENMIVHVTSISAASEHYIGCCVSDKNGEPFTFTVMDYALTDIPSARRHLAMEIIEFICCDSDQEELSATQWQMVSDITNELTNGTDDGVLNQMINELKHDFNEEQWIADDLLAKINVLKENNK